MTDEMLKPGGRFAVSDVVVQGQLPVDMRTNMELWAGCIAGPLEETTYRELLAEAGFGDIGVEATRAYEPEDLACSECCSSTATRDGFTELAATGGRLVSGFVHARNQGSPPFGSWSESRTLCGLET